MSEWVEVHKPCPCGNSSDAYCVNDAGWGKCFSCGKNFRDGQETQLTKEKTPRKLLSDVSFKDLRKRKISEKTARVFGYGLGEYEGRNVQVAPYHDAKGRVTAQKLRFANKDFLVLGKMPGTLFGQHLWRNTGGKRLVITEGEIDCMSLYQVLSSKYRWPVCSLPAGSAAALTAIKDNIEFIESFEEVVFAFDMDDPGQEAARTCVDILTPGKAKVAVLPCKDPNEALVEGEIKDLVTSIWEAQVRRPDGVVNAADLRELIHEPIETGYEYPWPGLNNKTYGQRPGEIVTWTAGSGIGKSAFVREIAYDLAMRHEIPVGYVALEESTKRTALGFLGLYLERPIWLPGKQADDEELDAAFDAVLKDERVWLYDHFGSLEEDSLMSKLRYMAAMGCQFLVLDHLTIVLSGLELADGERKAIDQTMTRLRSFAEQTGVGIHLVSHLSRPKGNSSKGHEDGIKPTLSELRGSHGIVQLSDMVIALQRNTSTADDDERHVTTMWVLKNRLSGETGIGTVVRYNEKNGRLKEIEWTLDEDGDVLVEPSVGGKVFDAPDKSLHEVQAGTSDF